MSEQILLEGLEPVTRDKCAQHRARATSEGLRTMLTAGFRTSEEQIAEYAKGRHRDEQGVWHVDDERRVVTRALPENAPHCRRAAYDLWLLWPTRLGKLALATMDPRDGWTHDEIEQQIAKWGTLVRIGGELGLECGAHWPKLKDWPHFERMDWRSLRFPV